MTKSKKSASEPGHTNPGTLWSTTSNKLAFLVVAVVLGIATILFTITFVYTYSYPQEGYQRVPSQSCSGLGCLGEGQVVDKEYTLKKEDQAIKVTEVSCGSMKREEMTAQFGQFVAYYFDRSFGKGFVCAEVVDEPAITYADDEFKGIDSRDLRIEYIGYQYYQEPTEKSVLFNAHGDIRITVNGGVLFDGDDIYNTSTKYTFPEGESFIEIWYENKLHVADFGFFLWEPDFESTLDEVAQIVNSTTHPIYYAGVYQPATDSTVELNLPDTAQPYILMLASNERSIWKLTGNTSAVSHVVITTHSSYGNRVENIDQSKVLYLDERGSNELGYFYDSKPSCNEANDQHDGYCQDFEALEVYYQLANNFSSRPIYFTGDYNPRVLEVPGELITSELLFKRLVEAKENASIYDPGSEQCHNNGRDTICPREAGQ